MKFQRLVVNGCSYMEGYANGHGHNDLAAQLGIPSATSLAIGGSANSRILRTTLKDSYLTDVPTMYVLGMTFISRNEIPILKLYDSNRSKFEGRWTNPQNQEYSQHWEEIWSERDTDKFVDLKLKFELYSLKDRTEDLMYRILSLISNLQCRGHQILIFQQADSSYMPDLADPSLSLFSSAKEIVHGFAWQAVPWQHSQGVEIAAMASHNPKYAAPADEIKHRKPGKHHTLNNYLINYIKEHKILE